MNDYVNLIIILNEIRLPENTTICYFFKNNPNDITTCSSIYELHHLLGYLTYEDYKDLVFEVHFEDKTNDYQFDLGWYDGIINNNEFILNTLRNIKR